MRGIAAAIRFWGLMLCIAVALWQVTAVAKVVAEADRGYWKPLEPGLFDRAIAASHAARDEDGQTSDWEADTRQPLGHESSGPG